MRHQYRPGSICHVGDGLLLLWLAVAVLMTAVLIMGMLVREKCGIANIGFESFLVLLIYIVGVIILVVERG